MKSSTRTIIIPSGVLNSDDVNVVVIPPELQNTTQPLIVRPTSGNRLGARSLPIWGDDLEESVGGPLRRAENIELAEDLDETGGYSDFNPQFESTSYCTNPPSGKPEIVHMSSRTTVRTSGGPPETVEMTFDAPEGVGQNVFQAVLGSGSADKTEWSSYEDPSFSSFTPQFHSSFDMGSPGNRMTNPIAQQGNLVPSFGKSRAPSRQPVPPNYAPTPNSFCGTRNVGQPYGDLSGMYSNSPPKQTRPPASFQRGMAQQSGCGPCSDSFQQRTF